LSRNDFILPSGLGSLLDLQNISDFINTLSKVVLSEQNGTLHRTN
jgi:hypothetical protein